MNDWGKEWDGLRRAVEIPASALTAVEVDAEHRAKELISRLLPILEERPSATVEAGLEESASVVFQRCHEQIIEWPLETGVLFIVFKGGYSESEAIDFWREMNALRESWAGLQCHVIFFLLPAAFRMLLQVADHLADWISLRLHFIGYQPFLFSKFEQKDSLNILLGERVSPKVAKQNLERLEEGLRKALQYERSIDYLTKVFYLPIFRFSMALMDLGRAEKIREKIFLENVPISQIKAWYIFNFDFDFNLKNFDRAKYWAEELRQWSQKNNDFREARDSFLRLGIIAQECKHFDSALEWYEEALLGAKKDQDYHGIAVAYYLIGNVWEDRGNLYLAEQFIQKSIDEQVDRDVGKLLAFSFVRKGLILNKKGEKIFAEEFIVKSIPVFQDVAPDLVVENCYLQLAQFYSEHGEFEKAWNWCSKAINGAQESENYFSLGKSYFQMGGIKANEKIFDEAESFYLKALDLFEKNKVDFFVYCSLVQLGALNLLLGKIDRANEFLIRSLRIQIRRGYYYFSGVVSCLLGWIAFLGGQDEKAEELFKQAIFLSGCNRNVEDLAFAFHGLGSVWAMQKKWKASGNAFLSAIIVCNQWGLKPLGEIVASSFLEVYDNSATDTKKYFNRICKEKGLENLIFECNFEKL
jgi:tetratricopeptide (TPR) repeat protein